MQELAQLIFMYSRSHYLLKSLEEHGPDHLYREIKNSVSDNDDILKKLIETGISNLFNMKLDTPRSDDDCSRYIIGFNSVEHFKDCLIHSIENLIEKEERSYPKVKFFLSIIESKFTDLKREMKKFHLVV